MSSASSSLLEEGYRETTIEEIKQLNEAVKVTVSPNPEAIKAVQKKLSEQAEKEFEAASPALKDAESKKSRALYHIVLGVIALVGGTGWRLIRRNKTS